jgi:uncharacterized protein
MKLETDLAAISKIAKAKEDENWRFRSFLKSYDGTDEEIDAIIHNLYQRISSEIDCKQCANCCGKLQPILNQEDIRDFSQSLGMPVNEFNSQYLVKDEEPGKFRFNKLPCLFLTNNLCTNYEQRPKDCSSFPHLLKPNFTSRLWSVLDNYAICPLVFNVNEHSKKELWH